MSDKAGIALSGQERARYDELDRSTVDELIAMMRAGITESDGRTVHYLNDACPTQDWSKDEVIEAILDVEFCRRPLA
ncbi:hypothetical protein [Nocardia noduli]|uniref:hypothetical protein n=1 Tax=Nocardia noduli TaxID=2815722 RepID=UPI001C23D61C|nr:hypothetical protein [Nocardia noduli]